MTDNNNSCSCAKKTCSHRFTKIVTVEVSKDVTVGQLYRYLSLHTFSAEQQSLLDLSLTMDKRGKSRGIAFIRVPCMLEDHILAHEGEVFKGKKLHFSESKRKHASLLKKGRWVRDYKTTTRATVCLNQLPLHRECYQDKAEDVRGFTEPVFDVGARLYHPKFDDDLDTVLTKAHSLGLREINLPCNSLDLCDDAIKLVDMYKGKFDIYFSAGVGPWYCKKWGPEVEAKLKTLYKMERCSSAGLIGLDFQADNLKKYSKEVQLEVFEAQVKLACKYGKSMMLVDQEAHKEMVKILERHKNYLPPCALWGYATDRQSEIMKYVELGCYIVVSAEAAEGQGCLSRGISELLTTGKIPQNRILLASDCPEPSSAVLPGTMKPPMPHWGTDRWKIKDNILLLKLENGYRREPQVAFVTRDLVASVLELTKDYCDEITRVLHDNTLKFFRIGRYKSDQKPRASVTQYIGSVFGSVRSFLSDMCKDLTLCDMVTWFVIYATEYIVLFILTSIVLRHLGSVGIIDMQDHLKEPFSFISLTQDAAIQFRCFVVSFIVSFLLAGLLALVSEIFW